MVWISPFWISISYPIINILLGIHLPIRAESAISLLSGSVCLFVLFFKNLGKSMSWFWLFLLWWNSMTTNNLERVYMAYMSQTTAHWEKPKCDLKHRRKLEAGLMKTPWTCLVTHLFPNICLACFLIELWATSLEVALHKMEWGLLPQLVIEKFS